MTNEEIVKNIRQGNNALMADLYKQNRGFIYSLVSYLQIDPRDTEDAMQDAYFGLYEAVYGFDENKGYKFLTYAKYYIQSAIQRGQGDSTHVPENIKDAARKIKRIQNQLAQELGRIPTTVEISQCSEYDTKSIKYILSAVKPVKSIYEPLADDLILGDTISAAGADFENDIADADEQRYMNKIISEAVNALPAAERNIIQLHYIQRLTNKEIAQRLNITANEVRKAIDKGLQQLRTPKIKQRLIDDEDIDRRTLFYKHRGVKTFDATWISSTEHVVFERENMRGGNILSAPVQ